MAAGRYTSAGNQYELRPLFDLMYSQLALKVVLLNPADPL